MDPGFKGRFKEEERLKSPRCNRSRRGCGRATAPAGMRPSSCPRYSPSPILPHPHMDGRVQHRGSGLSYRGSGLSCDFLPLARYLAGRNSPQGDTAGPWGTPTCHFGTGGSQNSSHRSPWRPTGCMTTPVNITAFLQDLWITHKQEPACEPHLVLTCVFIFLAVRPLQHIAVSFFRHQAQKLDVMRFPLEDSVLRVGADQCAARDVSRCEDAPSPPWCDLHLVWDGVPGLWQRLHVFALCHCIVSGSSRKGTPERQPNVFWQGDVCCTDVTAVRRRIRRCNG